MYIELLMWWLELKCLQGSFKNEIKKMEFRLNGGGLAG